jgi:hypothetical protein
MDGHLLLRHLRSAWIANRGGRVEDFLGIVTTVHLLTLWQTIHEECRDAIQEHTDDPLWQMVRGSLRSFDFFPGRHPFCGEMVGIERSRFVSYP